MGGSTLCAVFSTRFGEARSQPGVSRGSVTGPMMGDPRVALRTGPFGVAAFGPSLERAMMRGSLLPTQGGLVGSMALESPPSFSREGRGGEVEG